MPPGLADIVKYEYLWSAYSTGTSFFVASHPMISNDMPLIEQVKTNLVHYNHWTSIIVHDRLNVLSGVPPLKLDFDDHDEMREWVIPKSMNDKQLQLTEIESWFARIAEEATLRPKRVTIGLVNDDGTIVYYFIHDGIVEPRQN